MAPKVQYEIATHNNEAVIFIRFDYDDALIARVKKLVGVHAHQQANHQKNQKPTRQFLTMKGLNKVLLLGNLGKDPEVSTLEGNIKVAKFPLATTESFKDDKGQTHTQTEWHNIVLWRGLAELAEKYLKKGSTINLEGKNRTRTYEASKA